MAMNKKGKLNSLMLFVVIFLGFVGAVIMGIFVYGGNLVNQTFGNIDIMIGDQNFTEVYDETLGKGINAFLNGADGYSLGLLLGMIILMLIISFTFQEKQKTWIALELVILLVAFIFSVMIQRSYSTVINSSLTFLDIYSVDLVKTSKFVLNLPVIIPIVWAFIIILVYGLFKKPKRIGDIGF